jgi:pimeloyl-ACP methyl ester carboxylesterase
MERSTSVLIRDGVELSYQDVGSGEPALVFIHGWSGDHSHFAPQAERFGASRRVISVDLRGHGTSGAPEQTYTIEGFADDIQWICQQLGVTRAVAIGHSMGGLVAGALAARVPALIAGIVLVDSLMAIGPEMRAAIEATAVGLAGPDAETIRRGLIDGFFLPTDDLHLREAITRAMLQTPLHVAASAFAAIANCDQEVTLRRLNVPVLAIFQSTVLHDATRLPGDAIANLAVGQTVGAGHYIQLEVPEQVNGMIERFSESTISDDGVLSEQYRKASGGH